MKKLIPVVALSLCLLIFSAQKPVTEIALKEKAAQLHQSIFTIDTHCDTPMRLVRGNWDVGQYHEGGSRSSGKIDLPRMKQGGLDAEFFAVFLGQGETTPEGYAKVRTETEAIFNAIHQMCEKYSDLIELVTAPDDGYRL